MCGAWVGEFSRQDSGVKKSQHNVTYLIQADTIWGGSRVIESVVRVDLFSLTPVALLLQIGMREDTEIFWGRLGKQNRSSNCIGIGVATAP